MLRERLHFRRRTDSTVYLFDRCQARHGQAAWKRVDLELWLTRVPELGWRVVDASGAILAAPDSSLEADGLTPPLGRWRSDKNGTSHEYDLAVAQDL